MPLKVPHLLIENHLELEHAQMSETSSEVL
jgi:hypothetical protein